MVLGYFLGHSGGPHQGYQGIGNFSHIIPKIQKLDAFEYFIGLMNERETHVLSTTELYSVNGFRKCIETYPSPFR